MGKKIKISETQLKKILSEKIGYLSHFKGYEEENPEKENNKNISIPNLTNNIIKSINLPRQIFINEKIFGTFMDDLFEKLVMLYRNNQGKQNFSMGLDDSNINEQFDEPNPAESNMTNDEADQPHPEGTLRKRVYFTNGGSVSMQASSEHNSVPKDNDGPYHSIEIGYPSKETSLPEGLMEFINPGSTNEFEAIYSFVPADLVRKLITANEGVKSGDVPEMIEDEPMQVGEDPGESSSRADSNPFLATPQPMNEGKEKLKKDFQKFI